MTEEKYVKLAKILDNVYNNSVEHNINKKIDTWKYSIKLENNNDLNDCIKYFTDELITEDEANIEALLFVIVNKYLDLFV